MSEAELLRLLRCQSGATASTSGPAEPSPHGGDAAESSAAGTGKQPAGKPTQSAAADSREEQQQQQEQPAAQEQQQRPQRRRQPQPLSHSGSEQGGRRPFRGTQGPSKETRMAALRETHKQAGAAARYKQVRGEQLRDLSSTRARTQTRTDIRVRGLWGALRM